MKIAWFRVASFLMMAGVVLGAFGAHALKNRLSPESLNIYQTAVFYHFIHALGLFAVAWKAQMNPGGWAPLSGRLLVTGVLIFSGSLYVLALTGVSWLGAVTPIGGLLLITGWGLLALKE